MARKNLKVPEELFLALRDDKDSQQSWPHYLEEQCLHNGDPVTEEIITEIRDEIDTMAFNGAISDERAERLEQSLSTVEERTGRIEKTLEDLQR